MTERKLFGIWQDYTQNINNPSLTLLPREIEESWNRSRKNKLDPYKTELECVDENELTLRRRKVLELVSSSLPYLHKLFTLLKNKEALITLTDSDAVVLEVLANPMTYPPFSYPKEGTIHSEESVGTNAIGLAIKTESTVKVYGAEHWRKINHGWSCFATPLFQGNALIGCINVAIPIKSGVKHVPFIGMILSTANAIERELMLKRTISDNEKTIQQQKALLEFVDIGMIAIDGDGCIKQINQQALDIFKVKGTWEGQNISELIQCDYDFTSAKSLGKSLEEQDLPVKIGSSYLHISCSTFKVELDKLGIRLILLVRASATVRKIVNRASGASARYSFEDIIGKSQAMEQPLKIAHLASQNTTNVLVTGETGTGKELLVQAIHNASNRRNKPFIAINCGAISRELIRSELFGYEGGSFTGAKSSGSIGKFELAEGGTLFLDEIGELPLEVQSVLLRVLQTQEVVRIGGKYPIPINVRVIAATHRNLNQEVQQSTFRNDLYYRLNVLAINLPSLRERPEDIVTLTDFFIHKFSEQFDKPELEIEQEVYAKFKTYSWPGNIRELENVLQRAAVVCENNHIGLKDLPQGILCEKELKVILDRSHYADQNTYIDRELHDNEEAKKNNLIKTLERTSGNLKTAASILQVSRGTIYNMISRYELDPKTFRDQYRSNKTRYSV
jgi:transcriptional regulator of acetoin/glycerol metabolism